MASTADPSSEASLADDQDNDIVSAPSTDDPERAMPEHTDALESEPTDLTTGDTNDSIDAIDDLPAPDQSSNQMITAEATFTEATSADLPLRSTCSSVARILVKPGQVFRVQVDNKVEEVHGKCASLMGRTERARKQRFRSHVGNY